MVDAEFQRAGIFLVFTHEQVLNFCPASDGQQQQSGRDWIERAAMPNLFDLSCRLTSATTSCEVIPAALSTRRTPSGVAVNDIANFLQHTLFHFRE